jgi:cell division protein FtsB
VSVGWIRRIEVPHRGEMPGTGRRPEGTGPTGGAAERRAGWRRLGIWLGLPIYVAVVAFGWWRGTVAVRETRRELQGLLAQETELTAANRELAAQVKALHEEREARARAARESLDVAAPGEVIVIVPPPAHGAAPR